MATSQVIAGAYTGSYASASLNYTRRGYTIHWRSHGEQVNETDMYARTLVDIIGQGGDIEIEAVLRVDSVAAKAAFWPWGTALGIISTVAAPIGRRATDVGAAFVLTAIAATPAAVFAAPNGITAGIAILSPDQDLQILFSSQARDIPIRFSCLPAVGASDMNVTKLTLS